MIHENQISQSVHLLHEVRISPHCGSVVEGCMNETLKSECSILLFETGNWTCSKLRYTNFLKKADRQ